MSETTCKIFMERVNLRVARITDVQRHPNADKLYIESITLGDEERTIVSGLVPYYSADDLLGKKIILAANLKPAKLRGVESNGMLLAAEAEGKIEVITVGDAAPGERIVLEGFEEMEPGSPETMSIDEFFDIPIAVRNHYLYVDDKRLISSSGPVKTNEIKDGKVS
jgi:methionyl-tRNA synthetase